MASGTHVSRSSSVGRRLRRALLATAVLTVAHLGMSVSPAYALSSATVALSSFANPSAYGDSVTFVADVSPVFPETATPTGTVNLIVSNDGPLLSAPVDIFGNAFFFVPGPLSPGAHQAVAFYSGDSVFDPATSPIHMQTVGDAPTTTTVTASPDPSAPGDSVVVCARVATNPAGSTIPTGTVTFSGPGLAGTDTLDTIGEACVTTTTLASGTVTATYAGATGYNGSTGTTTVTVQGLPTTTTVTAVPNPSVATQPVNVCATVTVDPPGSGTPTGTVTFTQGGGPLNQTVALTSGTGCIGTTVLVTGTITAVYSGGGAYATSTGTFDATVNLATTTTTVTASPDPSTSGQSVSVCATVARVSPATGTPTGTVTFSGAGIPSQSTSLLGGSTCIVPTTLVTGTISAVYGGDASSATSTGTVAVTVDPANTSTAVTATPDPSVSGQTVTVCATTTTTAPGTGVPTGTTTFTGPGGLNQTATLDGSGQACITTTVLTTGTITAVYGGDAMRTTSTGTTAVTVVPAATTTAVTATANPSVTGELVTVCATVTTSAPGSGVPTGTATITGPGGLNQTATLDGTGQACVTTTTLATGTVTAVYNPDTAHTTSTGTVAVTVNQANTTTDVTAIPNPSGSGESVQVCASILATTPGSGTPTGNVTFTGPGGLNQTVPVDGSGSACFSSTTLASGTVTGVYGGDGGYNASTGSVVVTVNPAVTTTAVTATPNPSVTGQPVTVCATVTANAPATNTPTGTVTFTDPGGLNQMVTLTAGQACLTTTGLRTGTVTASYNGDGVSSTSSGTVTVTVNPADTTTEVTATPNPSVVGQPVMVCAQVTVIGPGTGIPTGTVTFTGSTLNDTVALDGSGQACVTSSSLRSAAIVGSYNGDGVYNASTGSTDLVVNLAATTLTATATPASSVSGQDVVVCATVAVVAPGVATPTGDVAFSGAGLAP